MPELICKVLQIGKTTYYEYKKRNSLAYKLVSYFSKDKLEEFINTGKIDKLELIKNMSAEELVNISIYKHNSKIKLELENKFKEIEELKKQLK